MARPGPQVSPAEYLQYPRQHQEMWKNNIEAHKQFEKFHHAHAKGQGTSKRQKPIPKNKGKGKDINWSTQSAPQPRGTKKAVKWDNKWKPARFWVLFS